MVDPIKGSGIKPPLADQTVVKEKADKTKAEEFENKLYQKNKSTKSEATVRTFFSRAEIEQTARLSQQQQIERMQRIAEIAKQIKEGTYKLADPAVLAEKIYDIITNKEAKKRYIRKVLMEELEKLKDKGVPITQLELKRLVQIVKAAKDEQFIDPELDDMLKDII